MQNVTLQLLLLKLIRKKIYISALLLREKNLNCLDMPQNECSGSLRYNLVKNLDCTIKKRVKLVNY